MACILDYQLKYYNANGIPITEFGDFISLQVVRQKNNIGTANVVVPASNYDLGLFNQDYRLEIFRNGKLVGNTCWLLQRVERVLGANGKTSEYLLVFSDTIDILTRRYNAYIACDTEVGDICLGTMSGPADDIMKYLMHFNYGEYTDSDAGTSPPFPFPVPTNGGVTPAVTLIYDDIGGLPEGRQMSDLEIQWFTSEAEVITIDTSFVQILEICQKAVDATYVLKSTTNDIEFYHNLWFDIEYSPATDNVPAQFMFKTWVGIKGNDLRKTAYIGPDFDNLNGAKYIIDWTNMAEIAYVLAEDIDNNQLIGSAKIDIEKYQYYYILPFGPIETIVSYDRNQTVPTSDEIINEGNAQLGKLTQIKSIEGTIVNTEYFDFGQHYNFGDILTLVWDDVIETVEIAEFTINVDNDTEKIDVPLKIIERL